jgi:hypothetical protein
MPNPVTFKIKILVDGKERVAEATAVSENLASAMAQANTETSNADKTFVKMTQSIVALDAGISLVRQLADTLNEVTQESRSFTFKTVWVQVVFEPSRVFSSLSSFFSSFCAFLLFTSMTALNTSSCPIIIGGMFASLANIPPISLERKYH